MSNFRYTRPENFPPIVKNLIFINVLVFIAQMTATQFHLTEMLELYPIMPRQLLDVLVAQGAKSSERFYPYQIATHMFAHANILHILFNMYVLWMFGRILENVWGAKRFLLFYLICGVGAAALHLAIQYFRCQELLSVYLADPNDPRIAALSSAIAPALGASGAKMGLLAAFAYLFPNTELYVMFIPIPLKAKWVVLAYVAYDLFGGLRDADNVAHFAHLGGALTGFILVLIWNRTNRKRFY
jgi:membrane associated rhomboid family serine protease